MKSFLTLFCSEGSTLKARLKNCVTFALLFNNTTDWDKKKNTPNSQSFYEIHESKEMFKNGDKKHRA